MKLSKAQKRLLEAVKDGREITVDTSMQKMNCHYLADDEQVTFSGATFIKLYQAGMLEKLTRVAGQQFWRNKYKISSKGQEAINI